MIIVVISIYFILFLADFFMTASEDGSMKFWSLEKAGKTQKYVPRFDRSDTIIKSIQTSAFTAIRYGQFSGYAIVVQLC